MGHHISAVVLRGPFDAAAAASFDLRSFPLTADLTLLPLHARYVDFWAEKLGVPGPVADLPLLNFAVVHRLVSEIAPDPLFALIETDYAGGTGSQSAAVYRGAEEVMAPAGTAIGPALRSVGPINRALRLLGVVSRPRHDEFTTVGLDNFRDFDDLFEKYA